MDVKAIHTGSHKPGAPGEFMYAGTYKDEGEAGILFACPCGCEAKGFLPFRDGARHDYPTWKWNGDRAAPTLEQPIHMRRCEWRGYLIDGVFRKK